MLLGKPAERSKGMYEEEHFFQWHFEQIGGKMSRGHGRVRDWAREGVE